MCSGTDQDFNVHPARGFYMLLELQVFNVQPARDRRTPGSLHLLHSPEAAASLL